MQRHIVSPGKCAELYRFLPDGTVAINAKFSVLWDAFGKGSSFILSPQLMMKSPTVLPLFPTTELVGVPNSSGFVKFSRVYPMPKAAASQSPIINEGIALQPFYAGTGIRPDIRLTYDIVSSEPITSVQVYTLQSSQNRLVPAVSYADEFETITQYSADRVPFNIFLPCRTIVSNSVVLHAPQFIYFKVNAPRFTIKVHATALTATPKLQPCNDTQYCINFDGCRIPVYAAKFRGLVYDIVPVERFEEIASLIEQSLAVTSLPVPLTPITDTETTAITVVYQSPSQGPIPMSAGGSVNNTINPSTNLYTQFTFSTLGRVVPYASFNSTMINLPYAASDWEGIVSPVLCELPNGASPSMIEDVVLQFTIEIDAGSQDGTVVLYVYDGYVDYYTFEHDGAEKQEILYLLSEGPQTIAETVTIRNKSRFAVALSLSNPRTARFTLKATYLVPAQCQ